MGPYAQVWTSTGRLAKMGDPFQQQLRSPWGMNGGYGKSYCQTAGSNAPQNSFPISGMRAHKTLADFSKCSFEIIRNSIFPETPCGRVRPEPKRFHIKMSNVKSRCVMAGLCRTVKRGRRVGRSQIAFYQQILNREFDPTRTSTGVGGNKGASTPKHFWFPQ